LTGPVRHGCRYVTVVTHHKTTMKRNVSASEQFRHFIVASATQQINSQGRHRSLRPHETLEFVSAASSGNFRLRSRSKRTGSDLHRLHRITSRRTEMCVFLRSMHLAFRQAQLHMYWHCLYTYILLFIFISDTCIITFPIYLCSKIFCLSYILGPPFASLIRMTYHPPQITPG
jgi:hypothetical protein